MPKKYVEVGAVHRTDGQILPVLLWWEDGRSYQIDRVLDIRRAASLKAGGVGRRYTCRICGKERYLWLEDDGKWFVESKEEQPCADDTP
jgi:hypothetical protein|nr:MAG TPA: U5 small nuclear ribonucleoprotein [Caudoviricetes sp.]